MDTKVRWLLPITTQVHIPLPDWRAEAQRVMDALASRRTASGYADAFREAQVIAFHAASAGGRES